MDNAQAPERRNGRPRDPQIDLAKRAVMQIIDGDPKAIYYMKQLQVLLERQFFHWIVGFALQELIADDELGMEEVRLALGTAKFIFHRKHKRRKLQIKRAGRVIQAYWNPDISHACGQQAENLFTLALLEAGFVFHGRHIREYAGRRWDATQHELDFIVERDSVAYGAEVKNTWDYIDREEMELKIRMCAHLRIRPLMIWRYAPKNYMFEVGEAGGYGMIFVAHIFPMGQEQLVADIREVLGMPCDSPRVLPEGLIQRFMNYHRRIAAGEVGQLL